MARVTKQQVESAKALDLLSYMKLYEPHNLVRKGNDYCTREHDSLIISENGLWHWFSRDISGKTALQYLIKVKNMDFVSAVLQLCNEMTIQNTEAINMTTPKKEFALPKAYKNNHKIIDYLKRRGISENIIEYCIEKELIYESKDYKNAIFVGFDGKTPKYAALRGTWQHMSNPFKGEVAGSNKRFSFSILAENSRHLIISEGAIDVLSVATIRQDIGRVHYLSIGGAYAPKRNTSQANLPKALEQYLKDHDEITKVELYLDNDAVGIGASFFIMNKLMGMGYEVSATVTEHVKDWNEYIVQR